MTYKTETNYLERFLHYTDDNLHKAAGNHSCVDIQTNSMTVNVILLNYKFYKQEVNTE